MTTENQHYFNMLSHLETYINERQPLGGFLQAVVSNDLKEAVGRADDININLIPKYVRWLYNYAPIGSWGSVENYERWIKGAKSCKQQ